MGNNSSDVAVVAPWQHWYSGDRNSCGDCRSSQVLSSETAGGPNTANVLGLNRWSALAWRLGRIARNTQHVYLHIFTAVRLSWQDLQRLKQPTPRHYAQSMLIRGDTIERSPRSCSSSHDKRQTSRPQSSCRERDRWCE